MRKSEPMLAEVHPALERTAGAPSAWRDLLEVLSVIMESYVDRAFGIDAVQQATAFRPDNSPPEATTRPLRGRERSGQRRRRRAIHTRTTKAPYKRRTSSCRTKAS